MPRRSTIATLGLLALGACWTRPLDPDLAGAPTDLMIASDFGNPVVPGDMAGTPTHHALLCDGVDDVVRLDASGMLAHANAFTIELWLRSDAVGPLDQTMTQYALWAPPTDSLSDNIIITVYDWKGARSVAGSFINYVDADQNCNHGTGQVTALLPPAAWHHYVAEYQIDKTGTLEMSFYIDGQKVATIDEAGVPNCFDPSIIHLCGGPMFPHAFFHGAIDDLRISSVLRYSSNFVPPLPIADGDTAALLRFESLPLVDESPHQLFIATEGDPQLTTEVHP